MAQHATQVFFVGDLVGFEEGRHDGAVDRCLPVLAEPLRDSGACLEQLPKIETVREGGRPLGRIVVGKGLGHGGSRGVDGAGDTRPRG